ncbi:hypothetical protein [Nannocystis bainbridge]|uniref:Uncharacterized protein n=1 Tax=Nannocystis bainbridge TaxID=2995303 RepID=A0ABT5DZ35_9BACT|nr:hypothetical protein [Nannocystis bainbridge]MDC0718408.1 hypothetical protein [Nannocystis bainbridge]
MSAPEPGPARPLRRDVAAALLVLVVWLVPIGQGAIQAAPATWWPTIVRDLGSISCLFRHRPESVPYFFMQVLREGRREWEPVDERALFPMEPFGYRTRFDRFMERFGAKHEASRLDLARWVADRDRTLNPKQNPVVAVRFLAGSQKIDPARPPVGHWQKPEPTPQTVRVLSSHDLREETGRPGR